MLDLPGGIAVRFMNRRACQCLLGETHVDATPFLELEVWD